MKAILLLLFSMITHSGFSQDTLIYKNGTIKPVKIIFFSEAQQLITYVQKQDTLVVASVAIQAYKLHSQLPPGSDAGIILTLQEQPEEYGHRPGPRKAKYTYSKWSVSTCLVSIVPQFVISDRDDYFYSRNGVITIEPEYRFHDMLTVKFPVSIGIPSPIPGHSNTVSKSHRSMQSYNWRYKDSYDHAVLPGSIERNYDDASSREFEHVRDVVFQFGICPKFFPFGQTRNALYIAQGLYTGTADYYRSDYYHTFNTWSGTAWNEEEQQYENESWTLSSEEVVLSRNPFLYFRYEALLGINFNFGRSVCLSIETGYSTTLKNQGDPDRVFQRIADGPYQLAYEDVYDPEKVSTSFREFPNVVNRIHLVYHFDGVRVKND